LETVTGKYNELKQVLDQAKKGLRACLDTLKSAIGENIEEFRVQVLVHAHEFIARKLPKKVLEIRLRGATQLVVEVLKELSKQSFEKPLFKDQVIELLERFKSRGLLSEYDIVEK